MPNAQSHGNADHKIVILRSTTSSFRGPQAGGPVAGRIRGLSSLAFICIVVEWVRVTLTKVSPQEAVGVKGFNEFELIVGTGHHCLVPRWMAADEIIRYKHMDMCIMFGGHLKSTEALASSESESRYPLERNSVGKTLRTAGAHAALLQSGYVIVLDGGNIQNLCSLALVRKGGHRTWERTLTASGSTTVSVPCFSCVSAPRCGLLHKYEQLFPAPTSSDTSLVLEDLCQT
ncbi:hypothetical protein JB92DRAFT_2837083 [Gautieria morchelliformis]|nr:hypothetical protein JB92DRAFT_2837083 [Gautieria morchelliformis]